MFRRGFSASPKTLPSWLFYDEIGSALFEEITRLPEYYPTRTERTIFESYAGEIMEAAPTAEGRGLALGRVLANFPVALLENAP